MNQYPGYGPPPPPYSPYPPTSQTVYVGGNVPPPGAHLPPLVYPYPYPQSASPTTTYVVNTDPPCQARNTVIIEERRRPGQTVIIEERHRGPAVKETIIVEERHRGPSHLGRVVAGAAIGLGLGVVGALTNRHHSPDHHHHHSPNRHHHHGHPHHHHF